MTTTSASVAPSFQNASSSHQPRCFHGSFPSLIRDASKDGQRVINVQFSSVHISKNRLSSSLISTPSGATPCNTLWILRFVMSKTAGCPSGTYHLTSSPIILHSRISAWRMSATPPPWGVALKKAMCSPRLSFSPFVRRTDDCWARRWRERAVKRFQSCVRQV